MRLCITIVAFCLSLVSIARSEDAPAADSVVLLKTLSASVVTIIAYNPNKALPGIGTGFFVAADRLMTNRHVLRGADRAEYRTADGKIFRIQSILAEDMVHDLVLLQVDAPASGTTALQFAPQMPEVGERIYTVSAPLGLEGSASDGMIAAHRDVPEVGAVLQHTAAVSLGSSGCPLVDASGKVVGIQVACLNLHDSPGAAGEALNFAVPAEDAVALKAGAPRTIADARAEIASDWDAPVVRNIDRVALRPMIDEDFKSAAKFFEDAVVRTPKEPDAWLRLGICRDHSSQPEGAIEAYRKAIALRPDFALAYNNLGAALIGQNQIAEALAALKQAAKLNPASSDTFSLLAEATLAGKKYDDAISAATEAIRLKPGNAVAIYNRGRAYLAAGNKTKAVEDETALAPLDPARARELKAQIDQR